MEGLIYGFFHSSSVLLDLLVSLVKQPFLFAEPKREQGMHGEVQVWDLPYFVRDNYRFLLL